MNEDWGKGPPLPQSRSGGPDGLAAEGLWVRRGAESVLRNIDLPVGPGEHVALVGPNGSGKTTLLLALKGVLPAAQGRVVLGGGPVGRFDLRVGLVFANPEDQGVAPVVEDDVAFGLETRGRPPGEIRELVEESLRAVGLWGLRAVPTHTLSGGQAQQLALAAVLALGAQFLLLDEATSMLSPWDRDSLMGTVSGMRGLGVGILHVTHQGEDLLWADRVVALADGSVVFSGSPPEYFAWGGRSLPVPSYEGVRQSAARAGCPPPAFRDLLEWLAR